jgi:flagellar assembly protein FliH
MTSNHSLSEFASGLADKGALMNIQKFQFDDFDVEETVVRAEPRLLLSEVEELQAQAQETGRQEGNAEAHASLEAQAVEAFGTIHIGLTELEVAQEVMRTQIYEEAVRLAMTVVRKVLPVWAEKQSLAEIEGLILACFKERHEEARIVIRLPDTLLDPIQARLDRLIAETGFSGKPVLLADPSLHAAEARVEWANGGAEWNFEAQLQEIETVAHRLTGTKTIKPAAGPEPLPTSSSKESTE